MILSNFFGVNVEKMFQDRFRAKYEAQIGTRFVGRTGFTFVVLDQSRLAVARRNWDDPLSYVALSSVIGPAEQSTGSGGTLENALRKLRYVLRTGMPSLEAEVGRSGTHLVLPGDYPWQGAGPYRRHAVATSGLKKQDDWAVCKEGVDMLISLQQAVNTAAILRADQMSDDATLPDDVRVKAKYLYDINVGDLFPDYAAAA